MSRLVRAAPPPGTKAGPGDDYRERLIKYIPAETIALYTFVDKAILSGAGQTAGGGTGPSSVQVTLSIVLFLVALVGTPAYLWRQRVGNQPWMLHAGLATGAFVAWSYTLGGSIWVYNDLYNTLVAAVVAPLFTYIAPFFEPKAT